LFNYRFPPNKNRGHLVTFYRLALFTLKFENDSLWFSLFIFWNSPDGCGSYSVETVVWIQKLSQILSIDTLKMYSKFDASNSLFSVARPERGKMMSLEKCFLVKVNFNSSMEDTNVMRCIHFFSLLWLFVYYHTIYKF
jgi:hypothetical protein